MPPQPTDAFRFVAALLAPLTVSACKHTDVREPKVDAVFSEGKPQNSSPTKPELVIGKHSPLRRVTGHLRIYAPPGKLEQAMAMATRTAGEYGCDKLAVESLTGEYLQGICIVTDPKSSDLLDKEITSDSSSTVPVDSTTLSPTSSADAGVPFDGITQTDTYTWQVDRALITKAISDPSTVTRGVRTLPAVDVTTNTITGFRLYAIKGGSVAAALGVKNGDILNTISGIHLTSIEQAMKVPGLLRDPSTKEVIVQLTRKGQAVTHRYQIK